MAAHTSARIQLKVLLNLLRIMVDCFTYCHEYEAFVLKMAILPTDGTDGLRFAVALWIPL